MYDIFPLTKDDIGRDIATYRYGLFVALRRAVSKFKKSIILADARLYQWFIFFINGVAAVWAKSRAFNYLLESYYYSVF